MVRKNIHTNTQSGFTLAVVFPTYSIHLLSCTNRKACRIGTTPCATSVE